MITYTISRHQGHRQYALSNRHGPETFRLTSTEDGRFRWSKEVHEPDNLYRDIVEEETDHLTAQSLWPKMARHLGIPTRETEVAITSEQVKNWLRDHAGMTRYTLAQNKILSSAEWKLADAIQKLNSLDHQTKKIPLLESETNSSIKASNSVYRSASRNSQCEGQNANEVPSQLNRPCTNLYPAPGPRLFAYRLGKGTIISATRTRTPPRPQPAPVYLHKQPPQAIASGTRPGKTAPDRPP